MSTARTRTPNSGRKSPFVVEAQVETEDLGAGDPAAGDAPGVVGVLEHELLDRHPRERDDREIDATHSQRRESDGHTDRGRDHAARSGAIGNGMSIRAEPGQAKPAIPAKAIWASEI